MTAYGREMDIVSGVVSIAYSHFYISEYLGGSEWAGVDQLPDFHTDDPVILTPGQLTVISNVQSHEAWVTLMLAQTEPVQQLQDWELLGICTYQPLAGGQMSIWGPATGPAAPAAGWLTGGQGDAPALHLDPASIFRVHVYAKGRRDSRARQDAAMHRKEWVHEGLESYAAVFIPAGPHLEGSSDVHSPQGIGR